jgi:hypothetical protein
MKKTTVLLFALTQFFAAQAQKKYKTSGWEIINSLAIYSDTSVATSPSVKMRFSAFLHFDTRYHFDFGKYMGIYTGYALRNVGFSVKYNDTLSKKFRVYTVGMPLAFKIGNMEHRQFFYAGAEAELALNYKEKTFIDKDKKKFNEWFSSRTRLFMPSVFAGVQLNKGFNLIAKYYLTGFFNKDFKYKGVKPYGEIDAQLFYIALSYNTKAKKGSLKKRAEKTPTVTRL